MSAAAEEPLLSPEALDTRLGQPDLFILDIRSKADGGRDAFVAGHVPGAVHSDYEADGWRKSEGGVPGLLPDAGHLSGLLGSLGLQKTDAVVIVSAGNGAMDIAGAARVFWTLKCAGHARTSLLDGGYRGWTADPARRVETGESRARLKADYPVSYGERLRSDLQATLTALEAGGTTFVDARPAGFFEGRDKAPSSRTAGRIPGASSHDYTRLLDPRTSRLLPKERLSDLFASVGDAPIVNYCNTGHTAALNWFVLSEILNRPETRLFDGSMAQWTQDPARPIASGPTESGD